MTTKQIDSRQKKFLLVLPLLAIPFLAFLFWSLGGGKNATAQDKKTTGLDMQLPGARLKNDSAQNKLSLYQQAEKDSMQFKQAANNDPYYHADSGKTASRRDSLKTFDTGIIPQNGQSAIGAPFMRNGAGANAANLASNEQAVNEKLAMLQYQVSHANQPLPQNPGVDNSANSDMEQRLQLLQAQVQQMQQARNQNSGDPQMGQLSDMLDKIRDIQNPGLARQKMQEESEKHRGEVFTVSNAPQANTPVSTLDSTVHHTGDNLPSTGFYSVDDIQASDDDQNTIEAAVATTQTLVNGSTVKLRLVNDVYINGKLIPQNTFVFGTAQLSGERLLIKINSIRCKTSVYPVSLGVIDLDGINGIYIPGAITRDVAKESADQGVQNLGILGYDNSLGAQAANAGITAAKTLFSRKVRLIKVTVKAGYQVLLRDEKQKQLNP